LLAPSGSGPADPGRLRAVIFDVDGTLAETERDGHRPAFNQAFRDHGLPYQWSVAEYGTLLATTGGRRRLARYLAEYGHADDAEPLARSLHEAKTRYFLEWIRTGPVRARPGALELMRQLIRAEVKVAVATTGSRAWVQPLLARLFADIDFGTVITGDDVARLKPDPEVYLRALRKLGLSAADAIAVEDSPPGLAAASAAGLPCLVVTSAYTREDGFPSAAAIVPGYLALNMFDTPVPEYLDSGVTVGALARLHASAASTWSGRR
jgi:HAD superfamily hydrolase (TIGR01509 family)